MCRLGKDHFTLDELQVEIVPSSAYQSVRTGSLGLFLFYCRKLQRHNAAGLHTRRAECILMKHRPSAMSKQSENTVRKIWPSQIYRNLAEGHSSSKMIMSSWMEMENRGLHANNFKGNASTQNERSSGLMSLSLNTGRAAANKAPSISTGGRQRAQLVAQWVLQPKRHLYLNPTTTTNKALTISKANGEIKKKPTLSYSLAVLDGSDSPHRICPSPLNNKGCNLKTNIYHVIVRLDVWTRNQ